MEHLDSKGNKAAACDWCSRRAPWAPVAPGPTIEGHLAAICVPCAESIVRSFSQMLASEKAKVEADAKRDRRAKRNKAAKAATAVAKKAAPAKKAPAKRAVAVAAAQSVEKPARRT